MNALPANLRAVPRAGDPFTARSRIEVEGNPPPRGGAKDGTLTVKLVGADEASAAIASLGSALELERADDVLLQFPDLFLRETAGDIVFCADSSDLFRIEGAALGAARALILESIKILPSERYCELATAIALQFDADIVWSAHGWPILSPVGVFAADVAEAGSLGNPAPRGGPVHPAGGAA